MGGGLQSSGKNTWGRTVAAAACGQRKGNWRMNKAQTGASYLDGRYGGAMLG